MQDIPEEADEDEWDEEAEEDLEESEDPTVEECLQPTPNPNNEASAVVPRGEGTTTTNPGQTQLETKHVGGEGSPSTEAKEVQPQSTKTPQEPPASKQAQCNKEQGTESKLVDNTKKGPSTSTRLEKV